VGEGPDVTLEHFARGALADERRRKGQRKTFTRWTEVGLRALVPLPCDYYGSFRGVFKLPTHLKDGTRFFITREMRWPLPSGQPVVIEGQPGAVETHDQVVRSLYEEMLVLAQQGAGHSDTDPAAHMSAKQLQEIRQQRDQLVRGRGNFAVDDNPEQLGDFEAMAIIQRLTNYKGNYANCVVGCDVQEVPGMLDPTSIGTKILISKTAHRYACEVENPQVLTEKEAADKLREIVQNTKILYTKAAGGNKCIRAKVEWALQHDKHDDAFHGMREVAFKAGETIVTSPAAPIVTYQGRTFDTSKVDLDKEFPDTMSSVYKVKSKGEPPMVPPGLKAKDDTITRMDLLRSLPQRVIGHRGVKHDIQLDATRPNEISVDTFFAAGMDVEKAAKQPELAASAIVMSAPLPVTPDDNAPIRPAPATTPLQHVIRSVMTQLQRITFRHEITNPSKRVAVSVERLAVVSEFGVNKAYESVWRRYSSLEQLLSEYNDTFSIHKSREGRTYVRLLSTKPRPKTADSGPPPLTALANVVEPGASSTAMGANASRAEVEKTYVSPSGEPDEYSDWSGAERRVRPSSIDGDSYHYGDSDSCRSSSEDIECSSLDDEVEPTMGSLHQMD